MKRIILCICLFIFIRSEAQQINPVPDYVFSNKMSVGRNAVTDTAAYFSIGPRYGAIRGMMPPMVTDTASMSATKRNGLLIFSIQKNKYLYWDSVGVKWAEMAGTAGSAITGSGVAGYMPEFTTSTNLDTTRLYHSAGRFAIGSTTTTNGVFNVYGGQAYFDTSMKVGTQTLLADEGKNEVYVNTTSDAGAYALQVAGTIYNTTGAILAATSGSVGIGTASPAYRFDVTGQVRNTTNAYFATTDGSVGIGTTSAQGKLDVYEPGTLNHQIVLRNGGTYHTGIIGSSSANPLSDANAWGIFGGPNSYVTGISNSTAIVLGTSVASFQITRNANLNDGPSATNFYLRNSDGQIGIGNTNPSYRLDVTGTLRSTGNTFLGTSSSEVYVNTTTDAGAYALQVSGAIYNTTTITTGAPSGGTAKPFKIGAAATVSPTSPNRTIEIEIDGTTYYLHAKTTND